MRVHIEWQGEGETLTRETVDKTVKQIRKALERLASNAAEVDFAADNVSLSINVNDPEARNV